MRRKVRVHEILILQAVLLVLGAPTVQGQADDPEAIWPGLDKPKTTDETSIRLLDLNLKARGGEALSNIAGIEKSGQLTEGRMEKEIVRIHARRANFLQKLSWTHLGTDHETILGIDGTAAWEQQRLPKEKRPASVSGLEARLLALEAMIPFLASEWRQLGLVFAYRGEARFSGKPTYRVHAWGDNKLEFELHFDQKTFHIVNYSHPYRIGQEVILVDRTPVRLIRVDNVLWEQAYEMRLRRKAFKEISYDSVVKLSEIDSTTFAVPEMEELWLRP